MESITNNPLVACAILAFISSFAYFYIRYKLKYWKRRGVQQLPNTHWFFGNFKDGILMQSSPGWHLKTLYHQSEEDAPFSGFYILHKPCLLLKDLNIIKQMFIKDYDMLPDRYFSGQRERDSIGMRNLFGVRGPYWKYLRRKITPTLTVEKIKRMVPLLLESGKPMMEHLNAMKPDASGCLHVDGQDINIKYATDIIANVGLGMKMDSFKNPDTIFTKRTEQFFHGTRRFIAMMMVFFLPKLVDVLGPIIYFNISYFKKAFWEVVKLREKNGLIRGDYIDSVLKLKNGEQNPHYKFEGDDLLDQAGQFFSGFESGSSAATFTLMELAKNKEAQTRAREDILKASSEHGWTYDGFREMHYLDHCVSEGLRLYPSVPFLDRRIRENYTIPGTSVVVERDTGVYVSISALQRDPKYFPNPDVFDPDRFDNGNAKLEAFLPFGIGPKVCVGSKIGMLHVKVVLALILQEYEVSCFDEDRNLFDPRSSFTLADNGIKMLLKKIK